MNDGIPELSNLSQAFASERVIDLTMAEDRPCFWPLHVSFQHKTYSWFQSRDEPAGRIISRGDGSYQTRLLLIDGNTGTHFDAPSHFIPPEGSGLPHASELGEISIDRVDPTQLIGPAVVFDCTDLSTGREAGVSPKLTAERIDEWEKRHGPIKPGEVALIRSDWDRHCVGDDVDAYSWKSLITGDSQGWPGRAIAVLPG